MTRVAYDVSSITKRVTRLILSPMPYAINIIIKKLVFHVCSLFFTQ